MGVQWAERQMLQLARMGVNFVVSWTGRSRHMPTAHAVYGSDFKYCRTLSIISITIFGW